MKAAAERLAVLVTSGGLVLILSAACVDGAPPEHEATAAITSASGLTSICDARPDVHAFAEREEIALLRAKGARVRDIAEG